MPLLDLANELLAAIARLLDADADIDALVRTNRRLYSLLIADLYRHNARHCSASSLYWAANTGRRDTLERAIETGVRIADHVLLPSAAENGHVDVVRLLLKDGGADVAVTDEGGWTPLGAAARQGHAEVVEILVDAGADMKTGYIGWTPLNVAANSGHADVVRYLLDKGADIEHRSESGWTPLKSASCNGHTATVTLLLGRGADVRAAADRGWTALHSAANSGHGKIVQLLVDHGADPAIATVDGWTPLTLAADKGKTEAVRALLDMGADISLACGNGWTPLTLASDSGHADIVKLLLDHGADIMSPCNHGWTPLSLAAGADRPRVVKLLLEYGANISATNDAGWSALLTAADRGHRDVVEVLLAHGADVKAATHSGWTALHAVAENGDIELAKLLLQSGADSMTGNRSGWTPFHIAAHNNRAELVEFFLGHPGTDVLRKDNNGRTAAFHAAMRNSIDVLDVMLSGSLSATAVVDIEDDYGTPPVVAATRNGHIDIVRKLLAATKYDLDSVDVFGRSIMYWAERTGNKELLALVKEHASRQNGHGDVEMATEIMGNPVRWVEDSCWCEVCTRCTVLGTTSWECPKCDEGCFLICAECYESGRRCRDTMHELVPHLCNRIE
ncbi:ankyrin [Purpureocillium lavendulum]|uniref:Ankyrin n=1 Tax=Purpureocillium lavendulum TaxID=1247861 RepID=A0AB34FE17_9HYPO|nr:ankyrin [Purpureocillium lavendulum]